MDTLLIILLYHSTFYDNDEECPRIHLVNQSANLDDAPVIPICLEDNDPDTKT